MKKSIVALAAVFVLTLGWCLYAWFDRPGTLVEVLRGGDVIARIDLNAETEPRMLRFESPDGGFNELRIEHGTVLVARADCRGNDCVRMGPLRSPNLPIICLPHKLTVRFARGSTGLDSVAQ